MARKAKKADWSKFVETAHVGMLDVTVKSVEVIADGFGSEPDRTYTGGEVARVLRDLALRVNREVRNDAGLPPVPTEPGRPE